MNILFEPFALSVIAGLCIGSIAGFGWAYGYATPQPMSLFQMRSHLIKHRVKTLCSRQLDQEIDTAADKIVNDNQPKKIYGELPDEHGNR